MNTTHVVALRSEHPNNALFPMFNACVMFMARRVWPQGYDLSSTDAPDSLKRLKQEFQHRGRITVYEGGSEMSIYGDAGVNQDFRAWHDWCHLALDANFTLEGETRACELQARHIRGRYGDGDTGRALIRVLEAEIIGQALYWRKYRKYVVNQRAFVLAYMSHPGHALCKEW